MRGVVTLGAGIAGLSFSYHFNHATDIYEKKQTWGGRCRSHTVEGFTFDEGIHISFTRDDHVRRLFAESVAGRYGEFAPLVLNYFQSHWVRHPVESNLKGLPAELVVQCLLDFIRAEQAGGQPAGEGGQNYHDWLVARFGRALTRHFYGAYTRKYWTVEPELLTTDWIGRRIYRPGLDEVLRGALSGRFRNVYYIKSFRYPDQGGYQSFLRSLATEAEVYHGFEVVEVDLSHKRLVFKNGFERYYDRLVSSIPLPELARCIKDCPREVREAAARLAHTSVVLVNLGIGRGDLAGDCHWFYIYDERLLPARVHFTSSLSAANAPPGCTGIQAEIYHSPYKPLKLSISGILEKTIESLVETGILQQHDRIILADCMNIKYANVLFNRDYQKNRGLVLEYLRGKDVHCIGRYGEWAYLWSDQSLLSGKRAAETLAKVTG
ncbi:protoporphyrinogen/coproporphyrinogen oxidase [Desulfoscipio geothermicus]|uniref:Protoporphyrinogen oxidase n=1 Tax=Desulfoscipio geothermicus DSM 3669 TaxID=1121426 RepID=A0A1I6DTG6_9FIRM|nr:FAD-dependent oxidoreductase [Desulfoscipio geothermicus]SFR08774.1 Protoporphyrinogen oxidase [Desulfoscipio geothermicus DSM 3669]